MTKESLYDECLAALRKLRAFQSSERFYDDVKETDARIYQVEQSRKVDRNPPQVDNSKVRQA